MKLLLSNNQLTRYAKSGDYATTTAIPLDGPLALTAQTLLAWLQSQLTEGEVSRPSVLGARRHALRIRDTGGRRRQRITICDFNPRKVIRRRDRARRRRVHAPLSSPAKPLPTELRDGCSQHGRK
jgi:hypothetical protein